MRELLLRIATVGWRILLVTAIAALGLAAVATMAGNAPISRGLGTFAWVAAFGGAVSGLLAGVGRKASS